MLLFISPCLTLVPSNTLISIHLMLLFIMAELGLPEGESHISIHLMLLFIDRDDIQSLHLVQFQYISCYCLSDNLENLNLELYNFNTSHVIVYPYLRLSVVLLTTYFNTSHVIVYQARTGVKSTAEMNFNTSHVIVYRWCWPAHSSFQMHFNTSHVIVYPLLFPVSIPAAFISIHLMLLFIFHQSCKLSFIELFQYISCYCLSLPSFEWLLSHSHISIHLMLLFILIYKQQGPSRYRFQYISCYCLSLLARY